VLYVYVKKVLVNLIKLAKTLIHYIGLRGKRNLDKGDGRVWMCRQCDFTEFTDGTVTKLRCPWCKLWCDGYDL